MFWLIFSCSVEKTEVSKSGTEFLDEYFDSICQLYSNRECGQELSQCGEPVTLFTDWAQCMNSQSQRTSLCGRLPMLIEENPKDISDCIQILRETPCTTEDMCADYHILFEGSCGAVEEAIVQECKPY